MAELYMQAGATLPFSQILINYKFANIESGIHILLKVTEQYDDLTICPFGI